MIIYNNYEAFKNDFKKDTGLEYGKETISEYLHYLNFRISDQQNQINLKTFESVQRIPENVKLEISQMILTHERITELLNLLGKN